ncbi:SIR2 family NAD-dependent protein deacylase [Sphingobium lignivorans]|uniref:SIR2-like domain-containing protein n=1 Tax=Sphingobium lignivorans TaxID=2735886 RepID=A0ABR6NE37_9SPHN|nr:SIR2 family protein [Sphingobium lignivorans]MBB5985326.1 hypothetical protein [Sphingobium lignivorans]
MARLDFTDEPHIERIAAALWGREPVGSAALLVGAGFSKNAHSVRGAATRMPDWRDIYETMVDQLYPASSDLEGGRRSPHVLGGDPRADHLRQAGAVSAYLRVAEEFEAQFGRDALDKLILRHLPDRQFKPGPLHHMLVALPWADVMTTNWDTLLERAAETAEERVYDVLRTVEEIPEARAPRIIKLHGSFPAHRPFVFTEEDFRKYPHRAGAFLNMAQQLAMENTLVLVGFSGDDPNFLFWSGWVRDQLGSKAPLIYLVGVLNLTAPKRKMLEGRRVQPIDLAKLPEFDRWPSPKRVENAHIWFLEKLRAAEPYPVQRWPRPPVSQVPPLKLVAPRFDPRAPLPDPEPSSIGRGSALELLRELAEQWRHNRKVYPGWVVPPFDTSELLRRNIQRFISDIVRGLREMDEDERLDVLFELNWQHDIALTPLILTVDDIIVELLEAMAPRYDKLHQDQAAQYRALALGVLRHAREESDTAMFERWAKWLDPRVADDPEASARFIYERCLKYRADLDIDSFQALLDAWTVTGNIYWQVRKAGLLADLGRDKEASDLSSQALNAIREQTARGEKDLASWSGETFAMLLRSSALYGEIGKLKENKSVRDRFEIRQEQLQARGCPGKRDFFDLLDRLIQGPPPFKRQTERTPLFDLGSFNHMHRLNGLDSRLERLLAYQALRFQEESGMPARMGNVGLSAQLLIEAARWLIDVAPGRAFNALLQAAPSGTQELDVILTRAAVSRIETVQADALIDRAIRLTGAARRRVEAGIPDAGFWRDRIKSVLEIASRVVLRAPARAPELLDLAVELNREEQFSRQIHKVLRRVRERALEAASPAARGPMLLTLFGQPIPLELGPNAYNGEDLADKVSLAFRADPSDKGWREIVEATIQAVRDSSKRRLATSRLNWLINSRLLDAEDKRRCAAALWAPEFIENGLPGDTVFYPDTFLTLPRPDGTDVQSILATALLTGEPLTDDIVYEGDLAQAYLNGDFALDEKQLLGEIERFHVYVAAHDPPPQRRLSLDNNDGRIVNNCGRMLAGLVKRALVYPSALEPLRVVVELERHPLRIEPAIPALIRLNLLSPEVAMSKVRALLAADEDVEASVLSGLIDELRNRDLVDPAFDCELWQAFSQVISSRQPGALVYIMRYTAEVMRDDPSRIPTKVDASLSAGLERILAETGTDELVSGLSYEPFFARYLGALLVTAMAREKRVIPTFSQAWAEAIDADPLPDMRSARDEAVRPVQIGDNESAE